MYTNYEHASSIPIQSIRTLYLGEPYLSYSKATLSVRLYVRYGARITCAHVRPPLEFIGHRFCTSSYCYSLLLIAFLLKGGQRASQSRLTHRNRKPWVFLDFFGTAFLESGWSGHRSFCINALVKQNHCTPYQTWWAETRGSRHVSTFRSHFLMIMSQFASLYSFILVGNSIKWGTHLSLEFALSRNGVCIYF